jgi:hypothetical protein
LSKKFYGLFLLTAVFFYPFCVSADTLNQKMERIVKEFQRQIVDIDPGEDYVVVVRTFFDRHTKKPSKRSEQIKDIVFQIVRDKYLGKSKVAVLNWRSETPLEMKDSSTADEVYYKQGLWEKNLVENFGKGFLVTGTTGATAEVVEIYAELIDLTTGRVLTSSKETLPLGPDDHAPVLKTMPAQELAAPEAAPEIPPVPAKIETAPEAAQKEMPSKDASENLQYNVIEGSDFKYEGYLKDGKKHGQGTLSFENGDKYIGQWQNDQKHGRGTYVYADGDKYEGQWKDNKMHGRGTYYFKSGNKFYGQWQNDQKHGQGTYYFKNGDKWEGTYVNNKKHGRGVYTWANGKSQEEVWANGKLVK